MNRVVLNRWKEWSVRKGHNRGRRLVDVAIVSNEDVRRIRGDEVKAAMKGIAPPVLSIKLFIKTVPPIVREIITPLEIRNAEHQL